MSKNYFMPVRMINYKLCKNFVSKMNAINIVSNCTSFQILKDKNFQNNS